MRAIIYKQYGGPDVASLTSLPIPLPAKNQLRIDVQASTVNRTDCGFRSANYFVSRFWSGLFKPKYPVLGCEFAGIVDEVGTEVTLFKPGDAVYGYDDQYFGGHAEYLCIDAQKAVAPIPSGLTYAQAAALTEGGHYALGIIRAAEVKSGYEVLVNGATGAIGSAAVQLLRHLGAHVTAVCPRAYTNKVLELGAEQVVDFESTDFTHLPQKFDFVLDAVGKSSFHKCKPLLKYSGIYISTELGRGGDNIWRALFAAFHKGPKVGFPIPVVKAEDIAYLGKLAAEGQFNPLMDRSYSLEKIVDAYRYVETQQKIGNVTIAIGPHAHDIAVA